MVAPALALAFLLSHCWRAMAPQCYSCEGLRCFRDACHGDFCVAFAYQPKWGRTAVGKRRLIKGCLNRGRDNNSLLSLHPLSDSCASSPFSQSCVCSSADSCNDDLRPLINRSRRQDGVQPLVLCRCVGEHCAGRSHCWGDYCSVVRRFDKDTTRLTGLRLGCVNASSLPPSGTLMLVRHGRPGFSCSVPPMFGALHHRTNLNAETDYATESCLCSWPPLCNRRPPAVRRMAADADRCPLSLNVTRAGLLFATAQFSRERPRHCWGQYCATIRVDDQRDLGIRTFDLKGCLTFTRDAMLSEALNSSGCLSVESLYYNMSACFSSTRPIAVVEPTRTSPAAAAQPKPMYAGGSLSLTLPTTPNRPAMVRGGDGVRLNPTSRTRIKEDTAGPFLVLLIGLALFVLTATVVCKFEFSKKMLKTAHYNYETVSM